MAEELLETVERLQARLLDNTDPRKLLKTFKRLGELRMTVEILVETGVGKTVNSFRRHEVVGEAAKRLVVQWKKLVPRSADRPTNSHVREPSRLHTHTRGQEPGGGGYSHPREPLPEKEPYYKEEEEEQGYHTNYSSSPPQQEQYSPPQQRGYHSDEYECLKPEPSRPHPSPPPPPPPPPSHKNVRHAKSNRESGKKHHQSHQRGDRNEEPHQHGAKVGGHRGGVEGKQPTLESPVQKSSKQNKESTAHKRKMEEKKKEEGRTQASKDSSAKEEEDFETSTMSFESFLTYDAPTSVKKKKKALPSASSSSSSTSHSQPSQSASAPPKSAPQAVPSSTSSSSSSSSSKANKARGTKRSHSGSNSVGATEEKRSRVVEAVPVLPEIPLPAIQPNYKPLPSIDFKPLSPQKRKVPVCNEEEDSGFTGKRLNSKMVVFSGSKTSCLPRMMTLYEQCIRVLQNNIDSIAEVGGVPFEILEPVLERCTPEQLYRIEQSNQWFTEDSDELWMRHCQRDFKREAPQEYESWRELYLRLHDEREERLKLLTQNISSAHANKPKARQVKMAFVDSVVKPPRDVRRRQEKFGTTAGISTAASTMAASPIKRVPTTDDSGELSRPTSSQQNHSTHSSSRSTPAGGAVFAAKDKPQVKKIAPMMAKTIKAFKNRFSRR